MTVQAASKNFDLKTQLIDRDTVGDHNPVSRKNFVIYLCGVTLAAAFGQISLYFFILFPGIMFLLAGALSLKDAEGIPDRIVDPISNIILGVELLIFLLIMYFASNTVIPAWYSVFLFLSIGLKLIICPILSDKMKKNRCSLPVTAVCVGVFLSIFDYRHKSAVYLPVWEYRAPVKTKILNEENVIPVWESSEKEVILRNGDQDWANLGEPHYGDERPIMIDPKHPYDVYLNADRFLPIKVVSGVSIIFFYLIILLVVK